MENEILTKEEVAGLLRVKPRTINYLVATRQMPAIKGVGREYRYLKSSIMNWMKQREESPESSYIEP